MWSNSASWSPAQPITSEGSTPPISPLTLPGNSNESLFTSARLDPIIEHVESSHSPPVEDDEHMTSHRRHSSVGSISFKSNNGTLTPTKSKPPSRIRDSSPPPPSRFQHHVSFDNFSGGEPTDRNPISFTLNVKHKGYQSKRGSRIFMVGIDENDYSDIALGWMLEELVDDGDQIICLRVVDKDAKVVSDRNVEKRSYQKEAKDLMERIQAKNDDNRAISIVLEFAVGKVHRTFQKMIQLYEPAMLIVGTRGRSLGGFQGLMSNRNSFSKWCLQYSPIPVVVVRPTEKRMKKKRRRDADPTRQDYARILRESGIEEHETDLGSTHSIFEASNDPDVEAHAVATALGLPAAFDPMIKAYQTDAGRLSRKAESTKSDVTTTSQGSHSSTNSRPVSPEIVMKSPKSDQLDSPMVSGEESSDDEEEGEFDVVDARTLVTNGDEIPEIERKKKLHEMEVGEAAALFRGRKASVGSNDSSGSVPAPAEEEEE